MNRKLKIKIVVLMGILVLFCNTISFSKYNNQKNYDVNCKIAKAIILLDNDECINKLIYKTDFPMEYNFSVRNYDDKNINEVKFSYTINVELSNNNFPISYKIINVESGNCVNNSGDELEKIYVNKDIKQIDKYKIIFEWCEKSMDLSEAVNIKLIVDAVEEI